MIMIMSCFAQRPYTTFMSPYILIGMDVGSTTVKAVVMDAVSRAILWSDYQRHETRQAAKVLEFLTTIESHFSLMRETARIFFTGSGATILAPLVGGCFVQEVNAVSLAVEAHHSDVGSVIELGGQDAKIIIWQTDPATGVRRKLPTMNDRCAGGTGAVIDKIGTKLHLKPADLGKIRYTGTRLHPVAGKCGVFAETDINGLQKQGIAENELMASLFEAVVQQNLSVLTRGNTLMPKVLLLGGPNTFIPAMVEAWRAHIPKIWQERNIDLGGVSNPESLIIVPERAEYYAAIGAVLYGREEPAHVGAYLGSTKLAEFIQGGISRTIAGGPTDTGLANSPEELAGFFEKYSCHPEATPKDDKLHDTVTAWMGIDGGSTSTKGVLLNESGEIITEAYQLSKGNPIADAKEIIAELTRSITSQGASLHIKGLGTTGYAKDILGETLGADIALVETIAHTQAALKFYDDIDVIVDVGGQDIKVIFLKNGVVRDFKLNTQCSAGNGYFLQSTSARFGIPVTQYAERAFSAKSTPIFSFGCAVFLEADIVNFQRLGWQPAEIMAGLAKVLPKNIWLYVVQEPNLRKFGTRFLLQGGTQRNLAAVKAQVDFIKERVPEAEVIVHQHCGISGAIGCALEAIAVTRDTPTRFIGCAETESLTYDAVRGEETRCTFCKNECIRTFIHSETNSGRKSQYIIASCEKGTATELKDMKKIRARMKAQSQKYPDLVAYGAERAFETFTPPMVARRKLPSTMKHRAGLTVGMPRVLNLYSTAPFFTAYLEALGVKNIVWSDFTSEALYRDGSRRGAIDPCFPSKVAISHVHNLLHEKEIDVLFFPTIITLPERLAYTKGSCACPSVQSAANVCKAGFTKEENIFAQRGVRYIDHAFHLNEPNLVVKQMFEAFGNVLKLGRIENRLAVDEGWRALERYHMEVAEAGRKILTQLEREQHVGLLMIGRPYHNDPGINHGILEKIQQRGYPILSMDSLPDDEATLDALFGADINAGRIQHPKDISDVFANPYSANTNLKIWAAKFAARHPNLAVIDMSNFKCGMDTPIYHIIEGILESTRTPYFTFHDIDENKPTGSITIRVETIAYALKQYEDTLRSQQLQPVHLRHFEIIHATDY